jgi:hypothetical protein
MNQPGTDPIVVPFEGAVMGERSYLIFLSSALVGFNPRVKDRRVKTIFIPVSPSSRRCLRNKNLVGKPELSSETFEALEYKGFPHTYLVM